ncbi:hypothetical protein CIRMBP1312_01234 [Enterococcus cecorum]|uniref:hypothetical protein n=1 Tax=Enterococcus cecorum TaxID=44008 RepID=UPI000A734317|nr:hypothetical protein [Enterococcus cecorum]CAI3425985.1 hypothetical protein CIRMBP1312_01234 [Enterococcus cecorum]
MIDKDFKLMIKNRLDNGFKQEKLNKQSAETTDIEFENELAEYYNNLDNFKTYQNQNEIKTDGDERANTALSDVN